MELIFVQENIFNRKFSLFQTEIFIRDCTTLFREFSAAINRCATFSPGTICWCPPADDNLLRRGAAKFLSRLFRFCWSPYGARLCTWRKRGLKSRTGGPASLPLLRSVKRVPSVSTILLGSRLSVNS